MSGEGGEYAYDPAAAQNAEDRVETAATSLQGSVDDLSSQVQQLASSWDAEEQQQYAGVHQKVSDGLDNMGKTLTQIKNALGDNTQSVSQMRQGVQNTISHG